jgi:CRP/FNR family transcriptional regulator
MRKTVVPNEMVNFFKEAGKIKTIEKGCYLFREGDPVNGLYMILSVEVKISKLSNDGNELTLRHAKPGDIAGELALLDHQAVYLLSAQMIGTGKVAILPKNVLREQLKHNGTLALELIQAIDTYTRRDQTRFRDLVLYGKKGALYSTLIRLSNSYGYPCKEGIYIDIRMTDQKLADFCGTSRESINRLMSGLKKNRVISTNKSYITIHQLDYLKKAINCAECPVHLCTIH